MKKLFSTIAAGLVPFIARAAVDVPPPPIKTTDDVTKFLCVVLVWMFWGLIVLSVAMFFVGGYIYATSGGDSEKVSTARKTLTYAAIAVAVAVIAKGIPLIVGSFFVVDPKYLQACGS